jgi:hypothetical protein
VVVELDLPGETIECRSAVDRLGDVLGIHSAGNRQEPSSDAASPLERVQRGDRPHEGLGREVRDGLWIGRSAREEPADRADVRPIDRLE